MKPLKWPHAPLASYPRRYYSFSRKKNLPIAIRDRPVIKHGRFKMVEVFPEDVDWNKAPFEETILWMTHPSILDKLKP